MTTSAVLIIPDAMKAATNAVGEALGYGPDNYSIALSNDGGATLTHWASRTNVGEAFQAMLRDPPPLPGLAEVAAAMDANYSEEMSDLGHLLFVMAEKGFVFAATT